MVNSVKFINCSSNYFQFTMLPKNGNCMVSPEGLIFIPNETTNEA